VAHGKLWSQMNSEQLKLFIPDITNQSSTVINQSLPGLLAHHFHHKAPLMTAAQNSISTPFNKRNSLSHFHNYRLQYRVVQKTTGTCMLCADQAIGQFWNPLSSVIAVKGGYIEHVQAVQHDHPSLQLLKIIVSETV